MKKLALFTLVAIAGSLATPVNAGSPKETHPCYGVADCKTQTSRKEFSKCVKANKEEADSNAECAKFRSDKKAYMKEHGITGLEALFN